MANGTTTLKTIIKLRRDNEFNYEKVKDTFVPMEGEPVLVDTARDGLLIKIGDGFSPYGKLNFINDLFIYGYYYEGSFYADATHTILLENISNKLYINLSVGDVYYYNGTEFVCVNGVPVGPATPYVAGIMKLYDTKGINTDGTMTQRSITTAIDEKFNVNVDDREELIIFTNK